jgi:hypothetical protein
MKWVHDKTLGINSGNDPLFNPKTVTNSLSE